VTHPDSSLEALLAVLLVEDTPGNGDLIFMAGLGRNVPSGRVKKLGGWVMAKSKQVADSEYSGIFAFEGDWDSGNLRGGWSSRTNLETLHDMYGINFIYRQTGTGDELRYYINKWLARGKKNYKDHRVGYFRFHGEPGLIYTGEDDVRLYQLERWIDGRAKGRVIVFHSCSTLKIERKRITQFLERTKAAAVVGYAVDTDSLEAIAFELLLLWALTGHEPHHAQEFLFEDYGELIERIGLTFYLA